MLTKILSLPTLTTLWLAARSDGFEVGLEDERLFFERGGGYGRHAWFCEYCGVINTEVFRRSRQAAGEGRVINLQKVFKAYDRACLGS